jgi:hypothetical protein
LDALVWGRKGGGKITTPKTAHRLLVCGLVGFDALAGILLVSCV